MSKELRALEEIKKHDIHYSIINRKFVLDKEWNDKYKIIETALKELEVKREVIGDILTGDDEKKLKALEIIKEKEVVIPILIRSNTLDEYNNNPMFVSKKLTKEEYNLLKEILL